MDCERAHKALAVVRVLADEVHTTGSIRVHGGSVVEALLEEFDRLVTELASHERKRECGGSLGFVCATG